MNQTLTMDIQTVAQMANTAVNTIFKQYCAKQDTQAKSLQEAMHYALANGGKRLRPLFVYVTGLTFGATPEALAIPAAAIELIHTYSLIHDDLPAMDNSDLRRGKPTCHKVFGDAMAILAGDALQSLAFEVLTQHPAPLSNHARLQMVKVLAQASGLAGMAGGQALDIEGVQGERPLRAMYQLKTGALFTASAQLGLLAAPHSSSDQMTAITQFANYLGLAFQLQDDLLDWQDAAITGKPQGLDQANNKRNLAEHLGIRETHATIAELFTEATQVVRNLTIDATLLCVFAEQLMQRKK